MYALIARFWRKTPAFSAVLLPLLLKNLDVVSQDYLGF